jgi:hypothetical protein
MPRFEQAACRRPLANFAQLAGWVHLLTGSTCALCQLAHAGQRGPSGVESVSVSKAKIRLARSVHPARDHESGMDVGDCGRPRRRLRRLGRSNGWQRRRGDGR